MSPLSQLEEEEMIIGLWSLEVRTKFQNWSICISGCILEMVTYFIGLKWLDLCNLRHCNFYHLTGFLVVECLLTCSVWLLIGTKYWSLTCFSSSSMGNLNFCDQFLLNILQWFTLFTFCVSNGFVFPLICASTFIM